MEARHNRKLEQALGAAKQSEQAALESKAALDTALENAQRERQSAAAEVDSLREEVQDLRAEVSVAQRYPCSLPLASFGIFFCT